jgi:RND family efflux transporter MFP subunit
MAPIADVHVRAGDRVHRGARLVTLDNRESVATTSRAAAALASALETARAADSDTQAADAQVRLARATYARVNALHDKRSATAQELDQATASLSAAEAQHASAAARALAAAAARDSAAAGLDAAKVSVSYSVLTAPFDGVVVQRSADPGAMAVPGTPLLVIEDLSQFRLEVELDEARVTTVQVGAPADVRLDNFTGERWITGRVSEIARIEAVSHSFLIKIDIPTDASLRSGVYGRARFSGAPRTALTVPASSIIRRGQLTFVFTVGTDGLARLRPISAAAPTGETVEVLAGIREGEVVVVTPPASLLDGTHVQARPDRELAGGVR